MERFARLAPSTGKVIIEDVRRPKGFFSFLEKNFDGARHKGILTPLHRICSLARGHGVQTVVIENTLEAKELHEENEDLERLGRCKRLHKVSRLSFFRSVIGNVEQIAALPPGDFIGYAIWKEDFGPSPVADYSRVYEAVMPPPPEAYIHVRGIPELPCWVAGRLFTAKGFPFYQQNSITNVCAHAAVRTLASCFQGKEMTFRQMNDVLNLTREDFTKRKGLFTTEIVELVLEADAECIRADFNPHEESPQTDPPVAQYQRFVYGSIESGFPAIIIFGENGGSSEQAANKEFLHAVTVFGHTFNRHMWVPRVEVARFRLGETTGYIPSDLWAGSFVGHDDTLGPHFTIPRHYMRGMQSAPNEHPRYQDVTEGVAHVICAQPKVSRMRPIDAELTALAWLRALLDEHADRLSPEWGARLLKQRDGSQLVLRPILVKKEEYLAHLSSLRGWNKASEKLSVANLEQMARDLLADVFWMVEVSVQELFPTNCRKLGEVLIDPKASKEDLMLENVEVMLQNIDKALENINSCVIAARLPGLWLGAVSGGNRKSRKAHKSLILTHSCLFDCQEQDDD